VGKKQKVIQRFIQVITVIIQRFIQRFPVFRGDSELDPIQADDLILFPLQG